jgi:hypothetical protein
MDHLPRWRDMSELDRGAALRHIWQRELRGAAYAVDNYPARYFEDPVLTGLRPDEACWHAFSVTGGYDAIHAYLGTREFARLYDLALLADEARGA